MFGFISDPINSFFAQKQSAPFVPGERGAEEK